MTAEEFPRNWTNRRQLGLIALALSLISGLLFAAYWFVLREDYAVLYRDLRPTQAASVVAALEAEGVDYRIAAGGAEILAPAGAIDTLRVQLAATGAPMAGVDGFELFNESDMGLTDFAQKIRYQRAIQGELARTIMTMQGVAEARVHVSIPERSLFRGERRNAEAAVTLVMLPGEEASLERVEGVQRLVAAAITDMVASDVVVLNARGEIMSSRVTLAAPSPVGGALGVSADFISEVMQLAIPHRRFDVRVEENPAPLAGAVGEDVDGNESPRLLITVATETSLTPEERGRVRTELETAGVIDGSSRQVIAFRVEPVVPDAHVSVDTRGSQIMPAAMAQSAPAPPLWSNSLLVIALAVLTAVVTAFVWRRARRPTLSFEEHRQLAERLKAQLASNVGAGDV